METATESPEDLLAGSQPDKGSAIFIMGPTASGKSGLALMLAERFGLEIVNADSVQVYRGMEIGAAKPTPEERGRVVHHLLDRADPSERYSAGRFLREAKAVLNDCRARGVMPLVVGGTGLYFRVLGQGIAPAPDVDPSVLATLTATAEREGWPSLHASLQSVDPTAAGRIHPNDRQRISRALGVFHTTGTTLSDWQQRQKRIQQPERLRLMPDRPREQLYARINHRFDLMMKHGFLEEVRALYERGLDRELPAMKAVGYRQLFAALDGTMTLEEAVEQAKRESRRYAKRQLTWLRREPDLHRIESSAREQAVTLVERYLDRAPLSAC
ncbi:MAG: tRNA (adenosine(37)-N6)-dimethylallyltransferase MiaA [Magnetococcales bacterium]|nr:tRNA (adenosine(37)-N6)-dimethylallyltransferase MiaA [Magnetococcales bacterium]